MDQAFENNPSSDALGLPYKRKRGRPRKDESVNRLAMTTVPPGFAGVNEKLQTNDSNEGMVGLTVTGIVEAAFDAGYLLSARIGNSICRGVVFKPGHIAPVTVENDIAPHVPVITRKNIHSRRPSRTSSSNQWLALRHRTTSMTSTTKGKFASPIQTVFPVGARGTVVPVVLQPATLSNHFSPTQPSSRDSGSQTAEPLSMLPYEQTETLPSQIHVNQQGAQEEIKQRESAETLAQDHPGKGLQDHIPSESNVSDGYPSQNVEPSLPEQPITVSQPLGRFPTGRMTELLLALQENMEKQVCHAEPPSSTSTADHDEESGE